MKVKLLGYINRGGGKPFVQVDAVYDIDGISPRIISGASHGNVLPKILNDMNEKEKVVEQVKSMLGEKKDNVNVIMQDNSTIRPRKKDDRLPVQKFIVQNEENSAETLTTIHEPKIYGKSTKYRIRRLTERECFRLMDVPEDSIDKMVSNISGTQCYKLAGNSIVISCLYHIFRKMFVEKENESKDGQLSLF